MTLLAAYTTVATRDVAEHLARAALENRLAACVQLQAVDSFYAWQGHIAHEPEVRILFKTTAEHGDALQKLVLSLHPYELPAFYAVEVARSSGPYAAWVVDNTSPSVTIGPAGGP